MILTVVLASAILRQSIVEPIDDVWVYSFAGDQSSDEFLRCWGAGGTPLSVNGGNVMGSWSNLRFPIQNIPADKELEAAVLILWDSGDGFLSAEQTKATPLQVRKATTDFEEENFSYNEAEKLAPTITEDSLFGVASPVNPGSGKPFSVTIDLLKGKGDFKSYLQSQFKSQGKMVGLALTSEIDPQSSVDGVFYKFYSRSGPKGMRPVLKMTFSD